MHSLSMQIALKRAQIRHAANVTARKANSGTVWRAIKVTRIRSSLRAAVRALRIANIGIDRLDIARL